MEKNKRYLAHTLDTRYHAVLTYLNGNSIDYVIRKYHISRTSLWRWVKRFDNTKESLIDKSSRPKSKHPKAHTDSELKHIKDLIKRNPNNTLTEIWYKLKRNYNYNRTPTALYRILRKLDFYKQPKINNTSKKHNKKYYTPKNFGEKWQIDVKYVPKECKTQNLPDDINFYQYTCIDEATRERYLYWYDEVCPANTIDFTKRCIKYFGYKPKVIQTDNGQEFTFNQSKIKKIHQFDKFLQNEDIKHYKIRPRTPQHNGKVERSHRSDNERFYNSLKFFSLDDLRLQGSQYLHRSNRIPMAVLQYLNPIEKRKSLQLPILKGSQLPILVGSNI